LLVTGGCSSTNALSATTYLLDGGAAGSVFKDLPCSSAYPPRAYHGFIAAQSALFTGQQLFVFGGRDTSQLLNDVYSADASGSNWISVGTAAWSPRSSFAFATVSDHSRVLVAGGYCSFTSVVYCSDAWISNVGLSKWTQLPSPSFSPRAEFSMVHLNGNMYVIGGRDASGYLNDVWVSPDTGRTWMSVTGAAGFSPRSGYSALVHNGALVVAGGNDGVACSDEVWAADLS